MHSFGYHRAASVDDAAAAFTQAGDARYLAGGQTLLASLKLRLAQPELLVDLGRLPALRTIERRGAVLAIGAMARHAEVAASPAVRESLPVLADVAGGIGDPMVRHAGTIAGSIANNDPAADWPAALLGLDAVVVTQRRRIAAGDFFRGLFETALEPGELVTAVEFPLARRAAYVKFKHPASRFALVGVFVAETTKGPRVAVTGAGPVVFRIEAMERALSRQFAPEAIAEVEVEAEGLNADLQATAEYRAHLVHIMARRAIARAAAQP